LGGIIGLAATSGGWESGLILSAFYSLGLAIPFLLVGVFFNAFLGFFKSFKRHLHTVEVISGVLLIAIGILVVSNNVTILNSPEVAKYLPNLESYLPDLATKPQNQISEQTTTQKQEFPAAPNVSFETLDGKATSVNDLRGRVVLLNLWATWCLPCRKEIPALGQLQQNFEAQGLTVVGLTYEDDAAAIKSFQKDFSMNYTVGVGKEPGRSELYVGLPTTYIIDRNGLLRKKITGERSLEVFEAEVKPLLEESANVAAN
jgi:thiol-disulfide isomerase/thioredoxin